MSVNSVSRIERGFEVEDCAPEMGFTEFLDVVGLALLAVGYMAFFVTQADGRPVGFTYIGLSAAAFALSFLVDVAFVVADRNVTSLARSVGALRSPRVAWWKLVIAVAAVNFLVVCLR